MIQRHDMLQYNTFTSGIHYHIDMNTHVKIYNENYLNLWKTHFDVTNSFDSLSRQALS